jgi:hypothetical protein
MSALRGGDERLHYCDSSHRWVAPPNVDQTAWNASMRAHLDLHRATMGGPVEEAGCPTPRIPRQRSALLKKSA